MKKIINRLFGHKYYANIINRRGTDMIDVSSFIFRTRKEADAHRDSLTNNRSFMYIETVSFRSRRKY